MKNKSSVLLKISDLPNKQIEDLGLSFRNIAKKCHDLSKKYKLNNLNNDTPSIDVINNQKKLRRDLSNWVNDPKNLVNCKGEYIGDKYGARITISRTDGLVIHDVETFCRDVKNINNRILGKNNNFIFIRNDVVQQDASNRDFFYSTLDVNKIINSNIQYMIENAYKVKSSSVPSSDQNSILIQYSPNETNDSNVSIESGEMMELHTTRKEFIQASCGKYGYASRLSKSISSINHYVCKNVEGDNGRFIFVRLSYFKFPEPTILDVAAKSGNFSTLITAVKAAGLAQTLSTPGNFTVFAPTNAAFNKLPAGTVNALLNNIPMLRQLLKYHVVAGKVMAADVVKLQFATTLAELNVTVRVENGKVYINDAQVIITDIVASNGVIHVIDSVLSLP